MNLRYYIYPASIDLSKINVAISGLKDSTRIRNLKIILTGLIHNFNYQKSEVIHINAFHRLAKLVTNNYAKYIQALINHGIIYQSEKFIVEVRTNGYSFVDPSILDDRINELNPTFKYSTDKRGPYGLLAHFLTGLEIDYVNAFIEAEQVQEPLKKQCYHLSISRFEIGDFYFLKDDYGRLHSNLTNLPKILRKYISYKNEKIRGIDLPNAQPLLLHLLCTFIKNDIPNNRKSFLKNLTQDQQSQILASLNKYPDHYAHFESLVLTRGLYGYIFNDLSNDFKTEKGFSAIEWSELSEEERGIVKDEILAWINGSWGSRGPYRAKIKEVFLNRFHPVYTLVKVIKEDWYKKMAHLLQTFEADLVIRGVVWSFHKAYPSAPVFTIHDCVFTTESYHERLKKHASDYMWNQFKIKLNWKEE